MIFFVIFFFFLNIVIFQYNCTILFIRNGESGCIINKNSVVWAILDNLWIAIVMLRCTFGSLVTIIIIDNIFITIDIIQCLNFS